MPSAYLKKLAKEGKGSLESLEKKWDEAKKSAADQGRKDDYAYITGILNHMLGITSAPIIKAAMRLEAAAKQDG